MFSPFSTDSLHLVTFSPDGVARGFYLELDDLVAAAKPRLTRTRRQAECQQYLPMDICPAVE